MTNVVVFVFQIPTVHILHGTLKLIATLARVTRPKTFIHIKVPIVDTSLAEIQMYIGGIGKMVKLY